MLLDMAIHTMTKNELRMVFGWAAKEGWNPGRDDEKAFYAADPNGYYLLKIKHEPAACIAAVKHSSHFAWLGLYIVKPEFRGKGYGKYLADHVRSKLSEYRTLIINGIPAQISNYQKSGYVVTSFSHLRWSGNLQTVHSERMVLTKGYHLTNSINLTALVDFDAQIFSTQREAFLREWVARPESQWLASVENNKVKGYGVISPVFSGFHIAPIIADDQETAEQLCAGLCRLKRNEHSPLYLDVAKHSSVTNLVKSWSFKPSLSTTIMYKGQFPKLDFNKIHVPATLEIG